MPEFVTHAQFERQFPVLVLDQRTLPKQRGAMRILLVSMMVGIEVGRVYGETEINAKLQRWVANFGEGMGFDRVAIRRALVDEGLLHRDAAGTTYVLRARTPLFGYDPSIRDLDLNGLVDDLERQRAERRRSYAEQIDREGI
ncbi:MAG: DUF2087 domain-containing protein [Gammaproteobacteria bacterium]|nr:DUF2087 domain-containing protein [Gammaproteobacteria bacterium]